MCPRASWPPAVRHSVVADAAPTPFHPPNPLQEGAESKSPGWEVKRGEQMEKGPPPAAGGGRAQGWGERAVLGGGGRRVVTPGALVTW